MAALDFSFGDGDPDSVIDRMLADYAAAEPGWVDQGDPIGAFLRVVGAQIDILRTLAVDSANGTFGTFGRSVINVPSAVETKATLSATVTFTDTAGHTFPAGTTVVWTNPVDGTELEWVAVSDVPVPVGVSSIPVSFTATNPGTAYNGVPIGATLEPLDIVAGVGAITAATVSSGGTDAETDDEYRDILAADLKTLRLVVANQYDAATLARNVPGVHRAFALEGWNPITDTIGGDPLDVGMVFLDEAGNDVPAPVKTAAIAYLQDPARRSINVVLRAGSPTYTRVQVAFTATVDQGYDPATVKATAEQAIRDFLDPSVFDGGRRQPPEWNGAGKVYRLDVVGVISRVPGIGQLQSVTLNGSSTADVTLLGHAPLPTSFTAAVSPSTVVGTVTA